MKRRAGLAVAAVLVAGAAWGSLGGVEAQTPGPNTSIVIIDCVDEQGQFVACPTTTTRVVEHADPTTSVVVPTPVPRQGEQVDFGCDLRRAGEPFPCPTTTIIFDPVVTSTSVPAPPVVDRPLDRTG